MANVKAFFARHGKNLAAIAGSTFAMSAATALPSFASGTSNDYTVRTVPTAQPMDFTSLGNGWNYAQSMLQDSLAIISQYPILVFACVTAPLISIGIGLFKKLIA